MLVRRSVLVRYRRPASAPTMVMPAASARNGCGLMAVRSQCSMNMRRAPGTSISSGARVAAGAVLGANFSRRRWVMFHTAGGIGGSTSGGSTSCGLTLPSSNARRRVRSAARWSLQRCKMAPSASRSAAHASPSSICPRVTIPPTANAASLMAACLAPSMAWRISAHRCSSVSRPRRLAPSVRTGRAAARRGAGGGSGASGGRSTASSHSGASAMGAPSATA